MNLIVKLLCVQSLLGVRYIQACTGNSKSSKCSRECIVLFIAEKNTGIEPRRLYRFRCENCWSELFNAKKNKEKQGKKLVTKHCNVSCTEELIEMATGNKEIYEKSRHNCSPCWGHMYYSNERSRIVSHEKIMKVVGIIAKFFPVPAPLSEPNEGSKCKNLVESVQNEEEVVSSEEMFIEDVEMKKKKEINRKLVREILIYTDSKSQEDASEFSDGSSEESGGGFGESEGSSQDIEIIIDKKGGKGGKPTDGLGKFPLMVIGGERGARSLGKLGKIPQKPSAIRPEDQEVEATSLKEVRTKMRSKVARQPSSVIVDNQEKVSFCKSWKMCKEKKTAGKVGSRFFKTEDRPTPVPKMGKQNNAPDSVCQNWKLCCFKCTTKKEGSKFTPGKEDEPSFSKENLEAPQSASVEEKTDTKEVPGVQNQRKQVEDSNEDTPPDRSNSASLECEGSHCEKKLETPGDSGETPGSSGEADGGTSGDTTMSFPVQNLPNKPVEEAQNSPESGENHSELTSGQTSLETSSSVPIQSFKFSAFSSYSSDPNVRPISPTVGTVSGGTVGDFGHDPFDMFHKIRQEHERKMNDLRMNAFRPPMLNFMMPPPPSLLHPMGPFKTNPMGFMCMNRCK